VFSRGRAHAELPSTVERLTGDRNGNLDAIRHRDWDAVLDVATFGPAWVRSLGEALGDRVGHYTFISTVSVYDNPAANEKTTEDAPVLAYKGTADPYRVVDHVGAEYGALKVLCEREAEQRFPGRTLVLRPGYIGGPGDSRALTYWAVRASKGGELLAGGDRSTPVQYIDVRDMAEWAVRLIEKRVTGIYNAVGPAAPMDLGQLVDTARKTFAPQSSVTWVPASWLMGQKNPETWGTLLFWLRGVGDIMRMSNERALASGLSTRPVSVTLRDTLSWYEQQPAEKRSTLITGFRRKEDGTFEPALSAWPEYLQREQELLAAWRARDGKAARP
jgi:2'-hydroxyisoflavone reductase